MFYFLPNGSKCDHRLTVLSRFYRLLWAILWDSFIVYSHTGRLEFTSFQVVKQKALHPLSVFLSSPSTGKRTGSADQRLPPNLHLDIWMAVWGWSGEKLRHKVTNRSSCGGERNVLNPVSLCVFFSLAHYRGLSYCLLAKAALWPASANSDSLLTEHSFY